jgi:hypothetical protein
MPGDPAGDLLGRRITLGRGCEQSGRCRSGGALGPGASDRRAGRNGLETASLSAPTYCAGLVDDDMPDLSGHAMCPA